MLACVAFLLTSCHSSRRLAASLDGPNPEQARYESVVRNQFSYDALQSKSRYSLGSMSLGGRLCLESGKRLCLLANAPLLGFEIARIEASQESVLIVDKYDKMYSMEHPADLYHLDELSGHELEVLECLFLGRIYIPGHGPATSRDYKLLNWTTPKTADGKNGNSVGVYTASNYSLRYDIDASGRLVSTMFLLGQRSILLEYAGYSQVGKAQWVPTVETITATDGAGQQLKATITLSGPEVGESTWRDFEPSSSYRQVPLSELVNTVKSMMK